MSQDVELWVRELEHAGWIKWHGRMDAWQSPSGHIFRGPYKAWTLLHSHLELSMGQPEPATAPTEEGM